MPFDIKQALSRLSRTSRGKLYYAFCERGANGQPMMIAHTKPIVDDDLEEFGEAIPAAARSKLAKGTMAMKEGNLLLKPKGGKSLGKDALEKGVKKAIELARAKGMCESISIGEDGDENESDEKSLPPPAPNERKKYADPIAANPKVAELLKRREEFVIQREQLDEDNPEHRLKIQQIDDNVRQVDGFLAKLGLDRDEVDLGKPMKTKELGANYKDEDKKFGWRADNVNRVKDQTTGTPRPPTPEEIAKMRERTHLTTKYDSESEKQKSQVDFEGGLAQRTTAEKLRDEEFGFVMDPATRKLHTFDKDKIEEAGGKKTITHHSTPLAGHAVAGAGHLTTAKGRIVSIDDASGHYKPDAEMTLQVVRELSAQGATLDTTMVDSEGSPIDADEYKAATEKLAKVRPFLLEYDKKRKELSAKLLKPGEDLKESECQQITKEIDQLADKFEKLSAAVQDEADLVRGRGPANRPMKIMVQGKEGITKDEFQEVRGNLNKINELLRKKLKIDYDLIGAPKPGELDSLPALNLLIGEKTRLELTAQQFDQTQGNEKQARQKNKVNQEIEELQQKKEAEEAQKARAGIAAKLKALGLEDNRNKKESKAQEMGVSLAYRLSDEQLDALVLGEMTVDQANGMTQDATF